MSPAWLALFLAAAARPASAGEATDLQTQTQELQRKKQAEAEVGKTFEQAKAHGAEGGRDISYEDVLADPDNIDLNYQYALSLIHHGELRLAAATLERITMVNPNLPKVRLLYAVVLFRLDNLDDSERELESLKKETMPASLRLELNEYLAQIRQRRRSTHLSVLVGGGVDFNDNRNAAPSAMMRLGGGLPFILDTNSTRKTDVGKTSLASIGLDHDLGYQAGHSVYANLNYFRSDQTNVRTLNLQNYGVEVGGVYKAPNVEITPSFEFDHLLLAETTYMRSRVNKLRFDFFKGGGGRFNSYALLGYTRMVFNRTEVVPTGGERTGDKIEGEVGLSARLSPSQTLTFGVNNSHTEAAQKFDAFFRDSLVFRHSWLLGKGQFLLTSLTINFDRYDKPDPSIAGKDVKGVLVNGLKRDDDTYRAGFSYGVPLALVSKRLRDFLWTFNYEYYQAFSSIPNYAYTNNAVSTLLTYRWER